MVKNWYIYPADYYCECSRHLKDQNPDGKHKHLFPVVLEMTRKMTLTKNHGYQTDSGSYTEIEDNHTSIHMLLHTLLGKISWQLQSRTTNLKQLQRLYRNVTRRDVVGYVIVMAAVRIRLVRLPCSFV